MSLNKTDLNDAKNFYEENGVAVLRNVLDEKYQEPMRKAIDNVLQNPGSASIEYTPPNEKGRYYGDFFIWRTNETFKNFAFKSVLPEIAANISESKRINFFYDYIINE